MMRLFEYEAKELLSKYGISIPTKYYLASNSSEVKLINKPVVIKAQVLIGGRGKRGGIKEARSTLEAKQIIDNMIGTTIDNFIIKKVLIEKKLKIARELYISVFVDRNKGVPLIMVSPYGGVDIEFVEKKNIFFRTVDPLIGLQKFIVRDLVQKFVLEKSLQKELENIIFSLYKIFKDYDAELVEINPLVLTEEGKLVVADTKVVVDDNAIYRQSKLQKLDMKDRKDLTDFERKAFELGVTATEMKGDIGIITSGAGLLMATADAIIYYGGEIGPVVDLGGAAFDTTPERITKLISLLKNLKLKAILFSFFLQIGRCDILAQSISDSLGSISENIPIVIRLKGNKDDLAKSILSNKNFFLTDSFEEAVRKVVEKSK